MTGRTLVRALVATALAVGLLSSGLAGTASAAPATTPATTTATRLLPLHATVGAAPAVVDASGRQVILRGVDVNSLGDYYQDDPHAPTVVPVLAHDWDEMAAHGFDVVRLLVSWSKLEPTRGHISTAYLRRIHLTVDAARARGIYTVIDMHQDAWGKYIASPRGVVCPAGRDPAIGWDGAPQWATLTDGAGTCTAGSREASEAVLNAWDSFYANREGIMDQLVGVWGRVAHEFRSDPAVAGYDLLNEPNHGHGEVYKTALATYYAKAIAAIRAQETGPAAFHHIVFFESTVFGDAVAPGFTTDRNIVFAPHNYGESIGDIPLDGEFAYYVNLAKGYGTALWTGEYGWFGNPVANAAKVARYAAIEDADITAGSAWWQWRQACGDPHSIGSPGGKADHVLIHFQRNLCPGDHDAGVIPQWACVWRPYPRASPGRLTSLRAGCRGGLAFAGDSARAGTVDVWYPGAGKRPPRVGAPPHSRVRIARVPGGFRITARVRGRYSLTVGP